MQELKNRPAPDQLGMLSFLLLVWLLALILALPVRGETPDPHQRWNALPGSVKDRIRQNYQRWKQMPLEKQHELKQRFQAFLQLPAPQRAQVIERYRHFKGLPEDEQRRIRERYQQFMGLPPQERQARLQLLEKKREEGDFENKVDSSPVEEIRRSPLINRKRPLHRDK